MLDKKEPSFQKSIFLSILEKQAQQSFEGFEICR